MRFDVNMKRKQSWNVVVRDRNKHISTATAALRNSRVSTFSLTNKLKQ
jgi:hypothetical protein